MTLEGFAGADPDCTLVVERDGLPFEEVPTHEKRTRALAITNVGTAGSCFLWGASLEVAGPEPAMALEDFPTGPIAPGSSGVIAVSFHPRVPGTWSGGLSFRTSDPARPTVQVLIDGSALPPPILVAPEDFDFGTVRVGTVSRPQDVCVYNANGLDLTASTRWTGPDAEAFSHAPVLEAVVVPSGDRVCTQVTFLPPEVGQYEAVLEVEADVAGVPAEAAGARLIGTGVVD